MNTGKILGIIMLVVGLIAIVSAIILTVVEFSSGAVESSWGDILYEPSVSPLMIILYFAGTALSITGIVIMKKSKKV